MDRSAVACLVSNPPPGDPVTLTPEQQLIAQQYRDIRTLLDLIECLDSCNAHAWWVNQLHAIQHRTGG